MMLMRTTRHSATSHVIRLFSPYSIAAAEKVREYFGQREMLRAGHTRRRQT